MVKAMTRQRGTGVRKRSTRREVPTSVPTTDKGTVDMVALLKAALTVPGSLSPAYSRFYRYSFLNMLLVFMQTGKLEPIGNYRFWTEKMNRRIISGKGSALYVVHPSPVYERDEHGQYVLDENGRKRIAFMRFYPRPTVFGLSQTDGEPLTFPNVPEWNREEALRELQIQEVPFAMQDGNTQGYSYVDNGQRKLAINPVAAQPFKTLIHEIAHLVLGHCDDSAEYAAHRGIKEFQAEAVSLLVCKELQVPGYDDSESRGYIQHWLGGDASNFLHWDDDTDAELSVTEPVVRQVFSAVDKILVAGRSKHFARLADSNV